MAFHELEKGSGRRAATNRVVISWIKRSSAQIRISGDLHKRIGSPSFVKIMLGGGEDAGFVAVIPQASPCDNSYAMFGARKQRMFTLSLNKVGIQRRARETVTVPHEITQDGLVLDLRSVAAPTAPALRADPMKIVASATR